MQKRVFLFGFLLVFCIIIMSKSTNRTRKIPKFIKKLKDILQDQNYSHLIEWLPDNNGFQILDASKFIDQVLPNYFKHKNMASFVRQLNMYGFTRPKESDQHAYIHSRFVKGNLNSMRQIQRRITDAKENEIHYSATQQEQSIEQSVSNHSLQKICAKLLQQNRKLKKQNEQLSHQLHFLTIQQHKMKSYQLAEPNFDVQVQTLVCKSEQKSGESNFEQLSSNEDKSKKGGFSLGENHRDFQSRLSYQFLIDGARNQNQYSQ